MHVQVLKELLVQGVREGSVEGISSFIFKCARDKGHEACVAIMQVCRRNYAHVVHWQRLG